MASGEAGRLVVTQVTPEVPGEKHIATVCSEKRSFEASLRKKGSICVTMFSCSQFLFFLLHNPPMAEDRVILCRWTTGKS